MAFIKEWRLFDPFLFSPSPPPSGCSISVIRNWGEQKTPFQQPSLTDDELNERFSLWEEVMSIDTFSALASGSPFDFDESMYPKGFNNKALEPAVISSLDMGKVNGPPLTKASLARNTIWSGGPYAQLFDEIREMCAISSIHFAPGLVHSRLKMMKIGRRAIRFAHELENGEQHRFPNDTVAGLHQNFIQHLEAMPKSFMPFDSLEEFATIPGKKCKHTSWKSHLSFFQDLLFFLSSFVVIHLPEFSSSKTYPLSSTSTAQFTSGQIIVALFRAIVSMVEYLNINEKSFQAFAVQEPVPGTCSSLTAFSLYLISSSALLVSRSSVGSFESKREVESLIMSWIKPSLDRFADLKPVGRVYVQKLNSMLNQ